MSEEKDFISDLSDEEKQNLADFFINLGAYIMYARQKPLADKSKEENHE